jgi:hypothetical protein
MPKTDPEVRALEDAFRHLAELLFRSPAQAIVIASTRDGGQRVTCEWESGRFRGEVVIEALKPRMLTAKEIGGFLEVVRGTARAIELSSTRASVLEDLTERAEAATRPTASKGRTSGKAGARNRATRPDKPSRSGK